MAKKKTSLKVRIPPYVSSRNRWRVKIHAAIVERLEASGITYSEKDHLKLDVLLYIDEPALAFHDVDNRLKDVMDALQGRAGGPKSIRRLKAIIPNDH